MHRCTHEQMHWFHTSSSAVAVRVSSTPWVVGRTRASIVVTRRERRSTYTPARVRWCGRAMASCMQVCGTCMDMREVHAAFSTTSLPSRAAPPRV